MSDSLCRSASKARVAPTQAEQPLGPEQVADGEQVDQEGQHPQHGHPLEQLVDLERDERRRADHRDVLPPALQQPQPHALEQLQSAVGQDPPDHQRQRVVAGLERLLDRVHGPGVLQVDPEPVPDGGQQRQLLVEHLLERVLGALEPVHAVGERDEQRAADQPLGRQQPEHERVPECPAPEHERRVVGRPAAVGWAGHERATAQAAPRLADRGLGAQAAGQLLLERSVRRVPVPGARAQVPVAPPARPEPGPGARTVPLGHPRSSSTQGWSGSRRATVSLSHRRAAASSRGSATSASRRSFSRSWAALNIKVTSGLA